jgi:hypothetical protein
LGRAFATTGPTCRSLLKRAHSLEFRVASSRSANAFSNFVGGFWSAIKGRKAGANTRPSSTNRLRVSPQMYSRSDYSPHAPPTNRIYICSIHTHSVCAIRSPDAAQDRQR